MPKPEKQNKKSCCWCPKTCITCLVFIILLLSAALGYGYFFIYAEKEREYADLQAKYESTSVTLEKLENDK